jgi:heterodisulfide reductase subunit B
MKISVYWGCVIPTSQYAYEMSVREIMPHFGVELVDLDGVSCCGRAVQSINMFSALYLGTRILAIAERTGLNDLVVACTGCHLSLFEAEHYFRQNEKVRERINNLLKEEDLHYSGTIKVWHIINFLHDEIGEETIKRSVTKPLNGMKIASHYGCHYMRPSSLKMIDDPEDPKKMDDLLEWLGAKSLSYPEKLDCCGAMLMLSHPDAAFTFSGLKMKAVQEHGADALVVCCPSCQNMFDARQKGAGATTGTKLHLPVMYYTQALGLAMGIDQERLGLNLNRSPIDDFLKKVAAA